jgi:hypothetical protein
MNWQNTAGVWYEEMNAGVPGLTALIAEQSALDLTLNLSLSDFTVLRSAEEPTPLLSKEITERSNYVWFSSHGDPTSISGIDITRLKLHPCVIFAVSCSAGRIDNVSASTSVVSQIIRSGANIYSSATRTTEIAFAIKNFTDLPPYDQSGNALGRMFFENMATKNMSVGKALNEAKKNYYHDLLADTSNPDGDKDVFETLYEFVLYGDPAFNPYEPCNEGAGGS